MTTFLERIVGKKLEEVEEAKARNSGWKEKGLVKKKKHINLKREGSRNIIAEIKRKSPSKGYLYEGTCAASLAMEYIEGGAKAISVLTDRHYFGGSPEDLLAVSSVAGDVPVLRKDFIIDEFQVEESYHMEADMVLLIARLLPGDRLERMVGASIDWGIEPLVEVHDRDELDHALVSGARLIGVNNRDLDTFEVDLRVSETLLPLIPDRFVSIVESGISSCQEMERLEELGADAFLIGESIVTADNPMEKVRAYVQNNA